MRSAVLFGLAFVAGCGLRPSGPVPLPLLTGEFASPLRESVADSFSPVVGNARGRFSVYPESVVLSAVHMMLSWRDRGRARYPMRLLAVLPNLSWAPTADDTSQWYPKPEANLRRTLVNRLVNAGDRIELDSLRLVVLTRGINQGPQRLISIDLETEDPSDCLSYRTPSCSRRQWPLTLIHVP
jgi:hypothetical protein